MTPSSPVARPTSKLPVITACWVSAPPSVHWMSSSMPCSLKKPRAWPRNTKAVSQKPFCASATLMTSSAAAGRTPNAAISTAPRATACLMDAIIASSQFILLSVRHVGFRQAAAGLLSQILPEHADVTAELGARDLRRITRPRQADLNDPLDAPRPIGHHRDTVAELYRLRDVVRDEQRR